MQQSRMTQVLALSVLFLTVLPVSHAKSKASPASGSILWDSWYTVTLNKNTPAQYFNEKVEMKQDKFHVQQQVWKKEEGYINEENLGAFALNSPELLPLFFNFRSTYRSTETTVDGTITDGSNLSVRMKVGAEEKPIIKRSLPKNVILESFFPLWAGSKVAQMKQGQLVSFTTIPENGTDPNFGIASGHIRLEAPDEIAKKNGASKISVSYRDVSSIWWIEKTGQAIRIEMPAQNAVVERVTREKAQKFLK